MKVPSKWKKKWRGGSYGAPKKWKKGIFSILGGPVTSLPLIFWRIWRYFHKAHFWSRKESHRAFFEKIPFWGLISNFRFFRFLVKNLKVKNAYLGDFSAQNEKNNYVFRKQLKSLLYKSVLKFSQKCIDTKLQLF